MPFSCLADPESCARHGVSFYWLVDLEGRAIEALVLGPDGYSLAVRASGTEPLSLPPFPDLALAPASLWPATRSP